MSTADSRLLLVTDIAHIVGSIPGQARLRELVSQLLLVATSDALENIIEDIDALQETARDATINCVPDSPCHGAYAPNGHSLCCTYGPRQCPDRVLADG